MWVFLILSPFLISLNSPSLSPFLLAPCRGAEIGKCVEIKHAHDYSFRGYRTLPGLLAIFPPWRAWAECASRKFCKPPYLFAF